MNSTYWLILFLGVPGLLLVFLTIKLVRLMYYQFCQRRFHDILTSSITLIFGTSLLIIYGNEKTVLVVALLSWIFLVAVFIRFALSNGESANMKRVRSSDRPCVEDPNSLNFSGVGPGFQGFGIYAGGVRVAHDTNEEEA